MITNPDKFDAKGKHIDLNNEDLKPDDLLATKQEVKITKKTKKSKKSKKSKAKKTETEKKAETDKKTEDKKEPVEAKKELVQTKDSGPKADDFDN